MRTLFERLNIKSKNTILKQYLATYLLILLLPFITGCFYYQQTIKIITENAYTENQTLLKQVSLSIDKRIDEITSITNQLTFSTPVTSFQYNKNPFTYPNSFDINKTQKDLSNYILANDFIENYFVFFNNSSLVLNSQIAYKYEDFYQRYFASNFANFEDFLSFFTQTTTPTTKRMVLSNIENNNINQPFYAGDYIFFCTPFCSYGKVIGSVVIVVKSETLLALFDESMTSDSNFFYMCHGDELLVSSSNRQDEIAHIQSLLPEQSQSLSASIGGKKLLITKLEPSQSKYYFVIAQSKKEILATAYPLKILLLVILLISIALSLLLSYLFARRSYRPIRQMILDMSLDESNTDSFDRIKDSLSLLTKSNSSMKIELKEQLELLHQSFLGQLINRDIEDQTDLEHICRCLSFDYQNHWFCVITFQMDYQATTGDQYDLTIVTAMFDLIKGAIEKIAPNPYFYQAKNQELALMLYDTNKENLLVKASNLASSIKKNLPKQIGETLTLIGSSMTNDLLAISTCFEETHFAFQPTVNASSSPILWYENSANHEKAYRFSLEDKRQLIHHAKAGNKDTVHKILHQVFTQNLVEYHLSVSLQKILLGDLTSCLLLCLSEINLSEQRHADLMAEIEALSHQSDLYKIKFISETFYELCDIARQFSLDHHAEVIDEVLQYINQIYCSPDLSLSLLSSKFNINESYLSYLFKQKTNQNFSTYVEFLRLERAKILLIETDKTVNEIASEIGYLSANSFCRAFKRVIGVTTTTFRNTKGA